LMCLLYIMLRETYRVIDFVVLFLAISVFFEFLCILLYAFIFPNLPIVKHYRSKAAAEGSTTVAADLAAAGIGIQPMEKVGNFFSSTNNCYK